jgi:hypothetical protein
MLLLNNRITNTGVMPPGQATVLSVGYTLIDTPDTWYTTTNISVGVLNEVTDPTLIGQLKLLVNTIHTDGTVRLYGSGTEWLGTPIEGDELSNFLVGAKYVAKLNAAAAYNKQFATLSKKESDLEQSTWSQQLAEANAVITDPNAATPLLTVLAGTRSITVAQYAQDVITAATAYATAQAQLVIGLKTEYQTIDTAATAQELKATGWLN